MPPANMAAGVPQIKAQPAIKPMITVDSVIIFGVMRVLKIDLTNKYASVRCTYRFTGSSTSFDFTTLLNEGKGAIWVPIRATDARITPFSRY
jgi:hypothetical protein